LRYSLFIDDERHPPRDDRRWITCRDWEEVMMCLRRNGMPGHISFDHDLGDHTHTGFDIAKFLVELDMDAPQFSIPPEFTFYVHSQNPIGKGNIESYLNNYLKFRVDNA